jgi:hypothetical protein
MARTHAGNIREIQLSETLGESTPEGQAARDACVPILRSLKEEFASIGIQLGARYDGTALIAEEPGAVPPEDDHAVYHPTSIAGGRAPHLWLPDGTSLYDKLGFGFALVRFDRAADIGDIVEEARHRALPFTVVDVDMPMARELYPKALVLIRPDQHIAWRGDRLESAAALLDKVTGFAI